MKNFSKRILNKRFIFIYFIIAEAILLCLDFRYCVNKPEVQGAVLIMRPFIEIMYTSLIEFAAVWITCYLLIAQVFKDRYSLETAEEIQLTPMSAQLSNIIVAVLIGVVMMFLTDAGEYFDECILSMFGYCIFTLYVIVGTLWSAKNTVKSMMTNTVVDKTFLKIKKEVKKNKELSKKDIVNIANIFEESVLKEDASVAENIIQKTEELFKEMLEDEMFGNPQDEKFKRIMSLLRFEISEVKNSHSRALIERAFEQQGNIMEQLLNCGETQLFEEYLKGYCGWSFRLQNENNDISREFIISSYHPFLPMFKTVIEKKNETLLTRSFGLVSDLYQGLKCCNHEENSERYAILLHQIVKNYYEANNDFLKEPLRKSFIKDFKNLASEDNLTLFTSHFVGETFLFLKEKSVDVALELYGAVFYDNGDPGLNKIYLDRKMGTLCDILKDIDTEYAKSNLKTLIEYRKDAIFDCVYANRDKTISLAGAFEEIIETSTEYTHKDLMRDYSELAARCLRVENKRLFILILGHYNGIYSRSKNRDVLVAFYKNLMYKEEMLSNRDMLNIFLYMMRLFFEQDYDKTIIMVLVTAAIRFGEESAKTKITEMISSIYGLCHEASQKKNVIDGLINIAEYAKEEAVEMKAIKLLFAIQERESQGKDQYYILDILADVVRDGNNQNIKQEVMGKLRTFSKNNSSFTEKCSRRIYNICVAAVENGDDETLINGFSDLGWILVDIMQKKESKETAGYVYDRITDIYDIAEKFGMSYRTKVSMITLFTTVGIVCHKQGETELLAKICKALANESVDTVKLAIKIRLHENDEWNDILEIDEEAGNSFINAIENYT